MAKLLEVNDFSVRFGAAEPVKGVSFSANPGEMLAIVGESGSGKSLTALGLMGLLPRHAKAGGQIRFDGRDLVGLPERDLRRIRGRDIAMIFQEPMTSLNPVLTIGDQIIEVLRIHEDLSRRQARERAVALLDLVSIPDARRRIDEYPHQLSGGMRQRVMIAIAVACNPKLLIADEATTALDVTIQAQVLQLLDSLRVRLNMAVILITHDLGIVAQWADRVVVMYAGRKIEEGLPGEVFDEPYHPYTNGLLSASPRLKADYHYRDGPLSEIPGSIVSAAGEKGCSFRPRCPVARPSCASVVPQLIALPAGRQVACPYVPAIAEKAHVASVG
ncbi:MULTISPECIES: ABC transporter ATP-binding protein [unclassified Rhizobium]|uniref:ABC transporter ATP-binding protein n=1 Tax=unclassified Rhizobium TaxID=2613769 RepID=UPI001607B1E3|nr:MULTISPECIES: ABC transporter ATP-binding protein [unclassified Rhizobium]MBB3319888.1 peptide/nickel transport system ATP-binding protein [Rhizobium sp. BK181]MBB3544670.1 peptide/nickel transport system ATP-binding protein [Rhizobium sp. BK399]MCS3743942.1 peptide/nickel transport system ATP-binding protein [Rhizobium sp. BK661]